MDQGISSRDTPKGMRVTLSYACRFGLDPLCSLQFVIIFQLSSPVGSGLYHGFKVSGRCNFIYDTYLFRLQGVHPGWISLRGSSGATRRPELSSGSSFRYLGWPSGAFVAVIGGLVGYVASCCRLMLDWGSPRRLPLETWGFPRWTSTCENQQSKLDVAQKCLEESSRRLLKSDGTAAETHACHF